MYVFIDTNIYSKLFTPRGDQGKYIEKLNDLISNGKISVVFPKIIQNELHRNIGFNNQISKVYKTNLENTRANEPKLKPEFDDEAKKKIEKAFQAWEKTIVELTDSYQKVINEVKAKVFDVLRPNTLDFLENEMIVQKAYLRKLKGYPPGKGQHIGDQLAWELLLENCIDDDLTIVADDSDWADKTRDDRYILNPFLDDEWKVKSRKGIALVNNLGEFIKQFPLGKTITAKDIAIEQNTKSPFIVDTTQFGSFPNQGSYVSGDWLTSPANLSGASGSISASGISPFTGQPEPIFGGAGKRCSACGYYLSFISPICPACGFNNR